MANKIFIGKVISDKMDKTVVVAVTSLFQHPVYRKTVKKISKFKAHDKANECRTGDRVKIRQTRPLSKDKRWQVIEILDKSGGSSRK